jgi:hypothetical protein
MGQENLREAVVVREIGKILTLRWKSIWTKKTQ